MPVAHLPITTEFEGLSTSREPAVAAQPGLRLIGYAVCESTDAADASFNILNGPDVATGTLRIPVTLLQNESGREWWNEGLDCANGITIEMLSGTINICLHHKINA